jgi:hypothetical protein
MPGLIYSGQAVVTAGVSVVNFLDAPQFRLKLGEDGGRRSARPRNITLHTTQGIPGGRDARPFILRSGRGAAGQAAENNAKYWRSNPSSAGAHLVTDFDCTHVQTADLVTEFAWHAGGVSMYGIGWEIVQGAVSDPAPGYPGGYAFVYEEQAKAVVLGVDAVTRQLGIQRQIHMPWRRGRVVERLAHGGQDFVGLHGHNDITTNRGQGDCGGVDPKTGDMDHIRKAFVAAGYEVFDYAANQDRQVWTPRQSKLNQLLGLHIAEDGIAMGETVAAIKAAYAAKIPGFLHAGARHGLWVARPGDEVL